MASTSAPQFCVTRIGVNSQVPVTKYGVSEMTLLDTSETERTL